jgi:hypothetical protein
MRCDGQNTCHVSYAAIQSRTVTWSFNIAPFEWINGGYAVGQTWGTSNDYGCDGQPHDEVCAWYNTAHTAYTVETMTQGCRDRDWHREGPEQIIKSPNLNNNGGNHYCVVNTCRSINNDYWDNSGRFGGPD